MVDAKKTMDPNIQKQNSSFPPRSNSSATRSAKSSRQDVGPRRRSTVNILRASERVSSVPFAPDADHLLASPSHSNGIASTTLKPPPLSNAGRRRSTSRRRCENNLPSAAITSHNPDASSCNNDGAGGGRELLAPSLPTGTGHDGVAKNHHFLKGIDLKGVDLLSIPSPPSGKQKRLRRQSTSLLPRTKAGPFQDLTNDSCSPHSYTKNRNEASQSSKATKNSKTRRSLCHVPSPLEVHQRNEQVPREQRPPEKKRQQHPVSIDDSCQQKLDLWECEDREKEHGCIQPRVKRPKRRQSIVLPSESGVNRLSQALGGPVGESNAMENLIFRSRIDNNDNSQVALSEIQRMVRSYTSLPEGSSQLPADVVDTIRKTGYGLSRATEDEAEGVLHTCNDTEANPDSIRIQRKEVLNRLGPSMQRMEEQKASQVKQAEACTGCIVEKGRNGKYRYISDNNKISADEYKRRYLQMVHQNNNEKSIAMEGLRRQIIERLSAEDTEQNVEKDPQKTTEAQEKIDCTVQENRETDRGSSGGALELDSSPRENMTKISPPCNSASPSQSPQEEAGVQGIDEPTNDDSFDIAPNEHRDFLLPIPSRDEESDDPDIARAESKLWSAIDTALKTYSREVLAIRDGRRAESQRNSTLL